MDLNHLNLRVRDAGACRDFYQRHFGFRPAFEADGGFFVRNDDGSLLALVPTAVSHEPLPDGFHIGFGPGRRRRRPRRARPSWPRPACTVTEISGADPGREHS